MDLLVIVNLCEVGGENYVYLFGEDRQHQIRVLSGMEMDSIILDQNALF